MTYVVHCDICEALEMQESIIRYSSIVSSIYEEMKVFDNEFYVEPSPNSKEPFRKKRANIHQKTGQAPCLVASQC